MPPNTKNLIGIQVYLPPEDLHELENEAEKRGMTLSAYVRWLVKQRIKEVK